MRGSMRDQYTGFPAASLISRFQAARISDETFPLDCGCVAIGAGVLLGFAGWPQPHRTLEFSGLILAAILTSALAMQQSTTQDWATMPPSFVIDFTSLLLGAGIAVSLLKGFDYEEAVVLSVILTGFLWARPTISPP